MATAAAGFAVFALHAGLDWDWEMPVVTLVALGCAGTVQPRARNRRSRRGGDDRDPFEPEAVAGRRERSLGGGARVAVVSVVLDGGRSAFAADRQYGQYGPYAPYGVWPVRAVREGEAAAHDPAAAFAGPARWSIYDAATISDGNSPTGTLVFRLFGPDDESCASAVFQTTVAVNGNGTYYSWQSGAFTPPVDRTGTWRGP